MTATELVAAPLRAATVRDAFGRTRIDGTVLAVNDPIGDALVDHGSIRHLVQCLAVTAAESGMATIQCSIAGLAEPVVAPGGPQPVIPAGIDDTTPFTIIIDRVVQSCRDSGRPTLVVIHFAEHVLPPDQMHSASGDTGRIVEQLARLATDRSWQAAGHSFVVIGRTEQLDERIARLPGVTTLDLGLPRFEERRAALELMLRSERHALHLDEDLPLDTAAQLLGGVPIHAINTMRFHTSADRPLGRQDVRTYKNRVIRESAGGTLRVHDDVLDFDTDVAGLLPARRFLEEERLRGANSVRVVLAGPPGNGKTRVSTAFASAWGVPAIELGEILGRYVGDSESNLARALETLEANAPVLLMLDEADQGPLGRRSSAPDGEGGQVTANLRAVMFSWLGDVGARLGISVIAMTNRPDHLDPAAIDRFTFLPVLQPSPWVAGRIMAIQARREGIAFDEDGATLALIAAGCELSGRQAVRLLGRAHLHSLSRGASTVSGDDVAAAIAESMIQVGVEEERQSLLAVRFTTWRSHLPWEAARHYGDTTAAPPPSLARFVRADGSIDHSGIDARLAELEARHGR
jgi:hypothetical protein